MITYKTKASLFLALSQAQLPEGVTASIYSDRAILYRDWGLFVLEFKLDHADSPARNLLEELLEEMGYVEGAYERKERGYAFCAGDATHTREIWTEGPTKSFCAAAAFVEACKEGV